MPPCGMAEVANAGRDDKRGTALLLDGPEMGSYSVFRVDSVCCYVAAATYALYSTPKNLICQFSVRGLYEYVCVCVCVRVLKKKGEKILFLSPSPVPFFGSPFLCRSSMVRFLKLTNLSLMSGLALNSSRKASVRISTTSCRMWGQVACMVVVVGGGRRRGEESTNDVNADVSKNSGIHIKNRVANSK